MLSQGIMTQNVNSSCKPIQKSCVHQEELQHIASKHAVDGKHENAYELKCRDDLEKIAAHDYEACCHEVPFLHMQVKA